MTLNEFFTEHTKVALAFSGGVDSSYLLYAAHRFGADIQPFFIKTLFQPAFELMDAKRMAESIGVTLEIVEMDVLNNADVRKNDEKRCYYCKIALFQALKKISSERGYDILIDGTNASDDSADRPGMKALMELNVRSPLREAGLTKDEIRIRSKEASLFTWDKPAYACLATRMPANQEITEYNLKRVEEAEDVLFSFGFTDFRVRLMGDIAKIQMPENQMAQLLIKREEIQSRINKFQDIVLDLKSR